jgi:hypothetical protein
MQAVLGMAEPMLKWMAQATSVVDYEAAKVMITPLGGLFVMFGLLLLLWVYGRQPHPARLAERGTALTRVTGITGYDDEDERAAYRARLWRRRSRGISG